MTEVDPGMSAALRESLVQLLADHGDDLVDTPKRLEGLLRDVCPEYGREIRLLLLALEMGTADALSRGELVRDLEGVLRRQSQRLYRDHFIDQDFARWAVESWALVLGHAVPAQTAATPRAGSDFSSSRSDDPLSLLEVEELFPERWSLPEHTWIPIPAGTFIMGSPKNEAGHSSDERRHWVHVDAFALLRTPVTFAMYDAYCTATGRKRPSDKGWGRGRRPVINVSYWDAVDYAAWLSAQTGWRCRLPTEAEWEYACRAGTTTPFSTGVTITTDQANYDGNFSHENWLSGVYRKQTTPVDQFPRNPWGLHDMHGNVLEWCASVYDKDYGGLEQEDASGDRDDDRDRVLRGGSWWLPAQILRSAQRVWRLPSLGSDFRGFRLARI